MSPIRNSANIDLYEREREDSENFESGAQTKKAEQPYFCGRVWRKADAWTLVCMSIVPGSTGSPSGLLKKKLCFIMCCHFRSPFLTRKKFHLFKKFQKVSKSFGFLNFVESRFQFILKSLYFWDRVSTFLKKSSRPVTVWFRFDKMNFHPTPIGHLDNLLCGTCHTADDDCDIVEGRLHFLISFVALKHRLFCELFRPLVSKFDGGSEFLTRNWIWEWFVIHLYGANISHRQIL